MAQLRNPHMQGPMYATEVTSGRFSSGAYQGQASPTGYVRIKQQEAGGSTRKRVHISLGMVCFALLVTALLLTMVCMNVSQWTVSLRNQQKIESMQSGIESIRATNTQLEEDIALAMDGEKIRNHAVNKLGMRPPAQSQVRTITID